jgi:excisionase family DNA binding protein
MSEIAELRQELAGVNAKLDSLAKMIRGIVERSAETPPAEDGDKLLTVKQAAARLECSPRAVYRLIENRKLPFVRIGSNDRSKRIRPGDLRTFERQQTGCDLIAMSAAIASWPISCSSQPPAACSTRWTCRC